MVDRLDQIRSLAETGSFRSVLSKLGALALDIVDRTVDVFLEDDDDGRGDDDWVLVGSSKIDDWSVVSVSSS